LMSQDGKKRKSGMLDQLEKCIKKGKSERKRRKKKGSNRLGIQ